MPATGPRIALVAQRTRASDYGSEGWGFESLRARTYLVSVLDFMCVRASDLAWRRFCRPLLCAARSGCPQSLASAVRSQHHAGPVPDQNPPTDGRAPIRLSIDSGVERGIRSRIPSLLARTCAGWFRPPTGPSEVLQPRRRAETQSRLEWEVGRTSSVDERRQGLRQLKFVLGSRFGQPHPA